MANRDIELELSDDCEHCFFYHGYVGHDYYSELFTDFVHGRINDPLPEYNVKAGALKFDGLDIRSQLWRDILVWLGFKGFGRYEVRYRYLIMKSEPPSQKD